MIIKKAWIGIVFFIALAIMPGARADNIGLNTIATITAQTAYGGRPATAVGDGVYATTTAGDMWMANGLPPQWIRWQFPSSHWVNNLTFINYNEVGADANRGCKGYQIWNSTNGADWTPVPNTSSPAMTTLTIGTGTSSPRVNDTFDWGTQPFRATYILMNCTSNWGDGSFVGLTEVFIMNTSAPVAAAGLPTWNANGTGYATDQEYNPDRNYGFQINFSSNITSVNFTADFMGASATYFNSTGIQNISDRMFWINFTSIPAGTYSFYWIGVNSSGSNTTSTWAYAVAKNTSASPTILEINGTQGNMTFISATATNVTASKSVSYGNLSVYRNGTIVSSTLTLGAISESAANTVGVHNYTAILVHQNYTSTGITRWLTISSGWSSYAQVFNSEQWETDVASYNLTVNIDITDIIDVNASLNWNGTTYYPASKSNTTTQFTFSRNLMIGFVPPLNVTMTPYWNFTIGHRNGNTTYNTTNMTQTIYQLHLTDCTGNTTTRTLQLRMFEEVNRTAHNATAKAAFTIWRNNASMTRSYSINYATANITHQTCVYPATAQLSGDMLFEYSSAGYNTRFYNIYRGSLTNSTQNIDLYLLGSSLGSNVIVTVKNSNGAPQDNAIVKVLRWYTDLNGYATVTAPITSSNGDTVIDLELNDAYYKFIIEKNGIVLDTISKLIVSGTELTLLINPALPTEYFKYIGQIAHTCPYSELTGYLSCTVSDTSGYVNGYTLAVKRIYSLGQTTICSASTASTAATLTCSLGNATNNIYQYVLTATLDLDTMKSQILESGYIEGTPTSSLFGRCNASENSGLCKEGLFMTFFITSILGMLTAGVSVALSMIAVLAGVGISALLGLVTIKWGTFIGIVIAAGIIMYKGRS